jgi:hypothetical protein
MSTICPLPGQKEPISSMAQTSPLRLDKRWKVFVISRRNMPRKRFKFAYTPSWTSVKVTWTLTCKHKI